MKKYISPIIFEIIDIQQSIILTGSNHGIQEYIPIEGGGGKAPGAKETDFILGDESNTVNDDSKEW